jgi:hypothetical protein
MNVGKLIAWLIVGALGPEKFQERSWNFFRVEAEPG